MKHKDVLLVTLLLLMTLGLTAGAVYQNTHHKNVTDAAVLKANKSRDAAVADASTAKLNLTAADTQLQTLGAQKAQLCAVLTAHKLTDNACLPPKE